MHQHLYSGQRSRKLRSWTVLSLLWMARRARTRGGFGPKASATLRSVYPIVLGLGGWFLGVLIVITTMSGVPLDDELLAGLSVGLPIGLGIYLAWVQRGWSGATKTAGFVAAVAGALAGAWLGFHADGWTCWCSSRRSSAQPSVRT